jgi:hypothetical protein
MAEKDPPKGNEKTDQQTGTTPLTPEMTQFLAALTGSLATFQKSLTVAPPSAAATEKTESKQFTDNAKIAVEKFNDIRAGLALKPPLIPPTLQELTLINSNTTVKLKWSIPDQADNPYGFKIQRAKGDTDPFADVADLPPSQTDHEDGPVTAGTKYRYRVVALTPRG